MNLRIQEYLAAASVVLVLIGLPALVYYYEAVVRPSALTEDHAQLITLTGVADGGIWTTDDVQGINYWNTSFSRCTNLEVDPSRPVVFRVRSADVLHSFSIPALRIRPIDVYPGHEIVVRLEPEDMEGTDEIGFLCWQVCGPGHKDMEGRVVAGEMNGDALAHRMPMRGSIRLKTRDGRTGGS